MNHVDESVDFKVIEVVGSDIIVFTTTWISTGCTRSGRILSCWSERGFQYQGIIRVQVCFLDVTHVINYDLPHEGDTYVHRGGRSGRKGVVMPIITHEQELVLDRQANKVGLNLKCIARQTLK